MFGFDYVGTDVGVGVSGVAAEVAADEADIVGAVAVASVDSLYGL